MSNLPVLWVPPVTPPDPDERPPKRRGNKGVLMAAVAILATPLLAVTVFGEGQSRTDAPVAAPTVVAQATPTAPAPTARDGGPPAREAEALGPAPDTSGGNQPYIAAPSTPSKDPAPAPSTAEAPRAVGADGRPVRVIGLDRRPDGSGEAVAAPSAAPTREPVAGPVPTPAPATAAEAAPAKPAASGVVAAPSTPSAPVVTAPEPPVEAAAPKVAAPAPAAPEPVAPKVAAPEDPKPEADTPKLRVVEPETPTPKAAEPTPKAAEVPPPTTEPSPATPKVAAPKAVEPVPVAPKAAEIAPVEPRASVPAAGPEPEASKPVPKVATTRPSDPGKGAVPLPPKKETTVRRSTEPTTAKPRQDDFADRLEAIRRSEHSRAVERAPVYDDEEEIVVVPARPRRWTFVPPFFDGGPRGPVLRSFEEPPPREVLRRAPQAENCHYHAWPTEDMAFHRTVRCHWHQDPNDPSIRYAR